MSNSVTKDPIACDEGQAAEWVDVESLVDWPGNPRKNDESAPKVAKLIAKYGFGTAMLGWQQPDGRNRIMGGHTRKKAVRLLMAQLPKCSAKQRRKWHPDGIRTAETGRVPVRIRRDLTEQQALELALADNKSAEWAEWDEELLPEQLTKIPALDLEDIGFDAAQVAKMTEDAFGLGDLEKSAGSAKLDDGFSVVIECADESQQLEVIEWAQERGMTCRALI
jgi:ParB-like chromosome segregation protein Spo0J